LNQGKDGQNLSRYKIFLIRSSTNKTHITQQERGKVVHTYECETCGKTVEIEEIEAVLGHHEYYEHGQCQDCFDKV
jgi:uncharacterized protein YlaI